MPICVSVPWAKRDYEIVFLDENHFEVCRKILSFASYGAALGWAYDNLDKYWAWSARVEMA